MGTDTRRDYYRHHKSEAFFDELYKQPWLNTLLNKAPFPGEAGWRISLCQHDCSTFPLTFQKNIYSSGQNQARIVSVYKSEWWKEFWTAVKGQNCHQALKNTVMNSLCIYNKH